MTNPARALTVHFLREVVRGREDTDTLSQDARFARLDPRDRRLATELVYGVLRHQSLLDWCLAQHSVIPLHKLDVEVLCILRVALYQLEFLRVPERAAVHEAVELCRQVRKASAGSFVNAVLRSFRRTGPAAPPGDSPEMLAVRYSHPEWLVRRWCERYGKERTEALMRRNNTPPPLSVWVNTFQIPFVEFCRELDRQRISYRIHGGLPNCVIVDSSAFPDHEVYRHGFCFLMDAASQEIANLSPLKGRSRLGDFCAAPGGKSFLLASRKEKDARLYCCDVSAERLQTLRRRAGLYRIPGLFLIQADLRSTAPLRQEFDFVLLDVPCSGVGTLRSNPDLRWRVQPSHLARFHSIQLAILKNGFDCLRPGGELLYSTCSTEPEENEEVIQKFLTLEPTAELASEFHRTFPDPHPGECFFAARVRHL